MKTFRRMQHSMRANLPDVRDPATLAEWEAKDPLPRLAARARPRRRRDRRDRARRRRARSRPRSTRRSPTRTRARTTCCRPSSARTAATPSRPQPGERALGFVAAIREALELELAADPDVIVIGEDIGRVGGLFRATEGLYETFGAERIRDTPLTESGFVGCGIGAALTGLRPVVELQFSDFAGVAFDQILNQAAKLRFMMGGTPSLPLVLRMVSGGGVRLGAQHSQSLEALFAHIPGLVVAMPSNPYDAKGLLAAAIQDDNPVIFLEQKLLFFDEPAPVPEERYAIELGKARVAREGTDVTVVALGALVPQALRAARELEAEGISVEVLDPRTLVPLDTDAIAASVAKTHTRRRRARGGPVLRLRRRDRRVRRRALLLGSRRAGRPRRRAVAPDPVPEGPRAGDAARARRRSWPPCARSSSAQALFLRALPVTSNGAASRLAALQGDALHLLRGDDVEQAARHIADARREEDLVAVPADVEAALGPPVREEDDGMVEVHRRMHRVLVGDGEADGEHARERREVRPRKPAPTSARVPCSGRKQRRLPRPAPRARCGGRSAARTMKRIAPATIPARPAAESERCTAPAPVGAERDGGEEAGGRRGDRNADRNEQGFARRHTQQADRAAIAETG